MRDYDGEDYGVADGEDYGTAEPPVPLPAAPRMAGGATSVAVGGPLAAMPTATVRRGVAASDDRKRKRTIRGLEGGLNG